MADYYILLTSCLSDTATNLITGAPGSSFLRLSSASSLMPSRLWWDEISQRKIVVHQHMRGLDCRWLIAGGLPRQWTNVSLRCKRSHSPNKDPCLQRASAWCWTPRGRSRTAGRMIVESWRKWVCSEKRLGTPSPHGLFFQLGVFLGLNLLWGTTSMSLDTHSKPSDLHNAIQKISVQSLNVIDSKWNIKEQQPLESDSLKLINSHENIFFDQIELSQSLWPPCEVVPWALSPIHVKALTFFQSKKRDNPIICWIQRSTPISRGSFSKLSTKTHALWHFTRDTFRNQ